MAVLSRDPRELKGKLIEGNLNALGLRIGSAALRALRAIRLAGRVMALHGETPRIPLEQVSYTADQVLSDWWPPEA